MKNLLKRSTQGAPAQGTKAKKVRKLSTLAIAGIVSASVFTGGALGAGLAVGVLDSSDNNNLNAIEEAATKFAEKIKLFDAQEGELKTVIAQKNAKISEIDNILYNERLKFKTYSSPEQVASLNAQITSLNDQLATLQASQAPLEQKAALSDQLSADLELLQAELASTTASVQAETNSTVNNKTLTQAEMDALKAMPAQNTNPLQ